MGTKISMRPRQAGVTLVMLALGIAMLFGFAGLVIDAGRLFVMKTELQSANDSCALAAAAELRPGVTPADTQAINRAISAGLTAGNRNKTGFQASAAGIASTDIYFSDHLSNNTTTFPFGYVSSGAASPATAKYVMCAHAATGINSWLMQVLQSALGAASTPNTVFAFATATTAPAQTNCGVPLGVCSKGPAPTFGLTVGQWISGRFSSGGGATGNFNWIDFTPPSGGESELAALITGQGQCNLNVTTPVGQTGSLGNAAAKAWNTRFGLYQGSNNITNAPPDYTGYAYTATNWPTQVSAFANFQTKRSAFASYGNTTDTVSAGNTITGLSINNGYSVATHGAAGQLGTNGADRRVVTAPIVDCSGWAGSQTVPIIGWACVLMLHPIDSPSQDVHMEYLGNPSTVGNPCVTFGLAGGTAGPLVPVLVH
jgi:Flp pilus assembly protein TadG